MFRRRRGQPADEPAPDDAAADAAAEDAAERLREAVKRIDTAAAAGVIHKNQAARRKSRLMRHYAGAAASEAGSDSAGDS